MSLGGLINNYLPENVVEDCKSQMFDCLINILQKNTDDSLKDPIVDNMFTFISAPEHVELAINWTKKGFIFAKDSPDNSLFVL